MASQGWKPGNFLGAQNSSHAEHFTAASASHIRVSLKDDTLGLGAKPRRPLTDDEPTGLDAFQGLLGRLNGKSDAELEKEERVVLDRKAMSYIERRWKCMHFVSGGLLKQEKQPDSTKPRVEELDGVKSDKKEKRDKKVKEKKEKKEKKDKKEKKEKSKDKKKRRRDKSSSEEDTEQDSSSKSRPVTGSESSTPKDEISESDVDDDEDKSTRKHKSKSKKRKRKDDATEQAQAKKSDSSGDKPSTVVKTREQIPMARQAIRSRYIQQKKRALMDAKSLNEVCPPHDIFNRTTAPLLT